MRLVLSISAAALAAGCLDPLVSDEPGVSVHVLPPGSAVPHVSTHPDLARQIRVSDGISDSLLTMSGGVIPQRSGWAKGAAVRYWDLGDAPEVGALLYVLVARSGDQVAPTGHPYVALALPGEAGYSPFLFVQHVVVTERYAGEVGDDPAGELERPGRVVFAPAVVRQGGHRQRENAQQHQPALHACLRFSQSASASPVPKSQGRSFPGAMRR